MNSRDPKLLQEEVSDSANPTNASLFGVEADVLEVVPQWENSEVCGADDGTGVEVDARQRHRLVDPGLTHNDSELAFSNT